jgi:hypothetical protein
MRATVDRKEFFQFQHGDGRVKPIERTAAYRVVELRDYMFKFVDSLRTCGTPATSRADAGSVLTARPVPGTCPQIITSDSALSRRS